MGLMGSLKRWIRGSEPTLVDYESYEQQTGSDAPDARADVLGRVGPALPDAGTYKIQQSYDSLLATVRELREALDGQTRRQEELLSRLSTIPAAVEALPQTSKMQSDMLALINDRLKMHAEQQRKVSEITATAAGKKEVGEALQAIKDQIEAGNEIDRQLVDSFNRFSLMIDRLHMTNNHAVECLQQVRDSYAASALQMQEWIEKSRQRSGWLIGGAFVMSLSAFIAVIVLFYVLFSTNPPTPSNAAPAPTPVETSR